MDVASGWPVSKIHFRRKKNKKKRTLKGVRRNEKNWIVLTHQEEGEDESTLI